MVEVRLQKFLASAGVASRRKSEELIAAGRVRVNGEVVTSLGVKVVPERDRVEVDGRAVEASTRKIYIVLNKPSGYITTVKDERGRQSVLDLVKGIDERIFPVGRLDLPTEGLLILTNDGDFAHTLMHPRHGIWKTYVAQVNGRVGERALEKLRRGILLDDGPAAPAKAELLRTGDRSAVKISIREGRKRQVRRMLKKVGHPVENLERIAYGALTLGDTPRGRWRFLTEKEVGALLSEAAQENSSQEKR